jgi:electron transfer flavoprotein beta subunit
MNIVVCVKQVPASNEVALNRETGTIIREGAASMINPYDTYALEEALRLKETLGGKITTISMGIPSVATLLQTTLALGADAAVLLTDRKFAGADTLATAYALAQGIRRIGEFDLIICGKQATDGDTAQVGPSLAEKLGVPHVTNVQQIKKIDEQAIQCVRLTDTGQETVELQLPAVITVVKDINLPRLPSIDGLRKAKTAQVTTWTAADVDADSSRIGLQGSPTQVTSTFVPDQERESERLQGDAPQQAQQLMKKLIQQRLLSLDEHHERRL